MQRAGEARRDGRWDLAVAALESALDELRAEPLGAPFLARVQLGLVLAESCVIGVIGGGLGLLLAERAIIPMVGKKLGAFLPIFFLPTEDLLIGVALIFVFGILAGLPPAAQAMRLRIVDALRRV